MSKLMLAFPYKANKSAMFDRVKDLVQTQPQAKT